MTGLVWTRAAADWAEDEALLAPLVARGVALLRLPCLRTRPVAARPPASTYAHLVFTSRTAVDSAVADPTLAPLMRGATLHTHGDATAARLRALGYDVTLHPARTAEQLAGLLAAALPPGAAIGLPAALVPAFDLADALRGAGLRADAIPCYETVTEACHPSGRPVTAAEAAGWRATLSGVVCFASPSAVRGFAAALAPPESALRQRLAAVAIGPTTASAATAFFDRVLTAATNDMASLVAAAAKQLGSP